MATEVETWHGMSFYAFLLRWGGEAFKTDVSMWSQGLKGKRDSFIRFGVELDVLELDLELTVDELRTAYQVLYGAPEHLARKKFAVVYHTDNFYVRTHKLLENVYGVLALSVGLDLDAKPTPGMPSRRENLRNALAFRRLTTIDASLREFEGDSLIREAREARNLFVHRYRDEPKWPVLGPMSRLLEFEDSNDTERLIRQELQPAEIDRYAHRKAGEFDRIVELIRSLRSRLHGQCLQEVLTILSKEPPEVRGRWQWLVDWKAFLSDLESG